MLCTNRQDENGVECTSYHEMGSNHCVRWSYVAGSWIDVSFEDPNNRRIDRQALVTRHNVTLDKPDPLTPLTVGNGGFAFTADITGLQTFPQYHEQGMSLTTQSQWGWHSLPNPQGYKLADALEEYSVAGRKVPYASGGAASGGYSAGGKLAAGQPASPAPRTGRPTHREIRWIRGGYPGPDEHSSDAGSVDRPADEPVRGGGPSVRVLTVCHPKQDMIAVHHRVAAAGAGAVGCLAGVPVRQHEWGKAADWDHPDRHTTQHRDRGPPSRFDASTRRGSVLCPAAWSAGGEIQVKSQHEYEITRRDGESLEIVVAFSPAEFRRCRCLALTRSARRRRSTGRNSGRAGLRSIFPAAVTRVRPSWNAGSCFRST